MEKEYSYDELVQLKQDGKIGWVDFVKATEDKEDYEKWCRNHGEKETEENALFFIEMTEGHAYANEVL